MLKLKMPSTDYVIDHVQPDTLFLHTHTQMTLSPILIHLVILQKSKGEKNENLNTFGSPVFN